MPLNTKLIREWIEKKCDGNQAEAARRMGMRPSHFSRMMRGDDNPTLSRLERMADVIGVDPGKLFSRAAGGAPDPPAGTEQRPDRPADPPFSRRN